MVRTHCLGIEDQKSLFALIKFLEADKLDSEKSEKVIEAFREGLVKASAKVLSPLSTLRQRRYTRIINSFASL